jgi:hypothetical protein
VAKEYNLRRHYATLHKDKFGAQEVKLREDKLQKLKSDLQRQQNNLLLLLNHMQEQFNGVLLFHKSLPKTSEPFMDGENVNTCIMKAAEILYKKKQQLFKVVSFSPNTVTE